jgi:hypothetical protein
LKIFSEKLENLGPFLVVEEKKGLILVPFGHFRFAQQGFGGFDASNPIKKF